ncbi:Aldehyde/histidinol dehydrogenase [Halteromyces radiatus]|uniref:Aldehyde/histidinol dehydrogenase n=1 Tax=Halteromyces radiatus TaxID=101107 RepID=UPI0022206E65|nr:Aldehyde/histidinol dehydrogenase [Halteromyces radiatus]KAI8097217.1 Aldehyde/histidinol dehydrogenase [Halteromyces radiatus]
MERRRCGTAVIQKRWENLVKRRIHFLFFFSFSFSSFLFNMATLEYTPLSDIPGIINDVKQTFRTGLTKDLAFRKKQLKQLIRYFEENEAEIEKVVWSDLKKHRMEVLAETAPVVNECKYMLDNLDRLAKPTSPKKVYWINAMDTTFVRKEPKGVVLVLGAWNYPIHLALMPVVGAIAAGNCVILKPSEISSHTANFMAKTITSYLDQRFFKVINGAVQETSAILNHPFDHIFYTGGGTVGTIVMEKAAKFLTPVTLELGGKSPTYVTPESVNQVTANRIVWGKFYNNGQTCVAPDYVLVHRDHAEKMVSALQKSIRDFYGLYAEKSNSYGRIINQRQFDRLVSLLNGVPSETIVLGGYSHQDDLFIAPTIVYPAPARGVALMNDEIFGPILPVVPVDNVDEAIEIINQKPQPLVTYIFSDNKTEINKVLDQTSSGGVLVNDTLMHVVETSLPFGGIGGSGMGNYHGDRSFTTFSHERSTMIKSTALEPVIGARYPPYNDDKYNLFSVLINGLPASIGAKLQTIKTVLGSSYRVLFSSSPAPDSDIL